MNDAQIKSGTDAVQGALKALGMCRAAGKTVCGTDLICRALHRKGTVACVVMASDASEGTAKRISDKCTFYGVSLYRIQASMADLAYAVGKRGGQTAAVAITDHNLAGLFKTKLGVGMQGQE